MGSFYTATLYPKSNSGDVKDLLDGKNFYICSGTDDYSLVTEEKMDKQNQREILNFVKDLSEKVDAPIVSYMVHDSDVLWFVVYKNGEQVFIIDNTEEYFNDGDFVLNETEDVSSFFGVDESIWKKEISKEKFYGCIFADDFLIKILELLNLPNWVRGVGYTYLSEDEELVSYLNAQGILVKKYQEED